MRLLLDTHSFLWFIEDSPRLSIDARKVIEDDSSDVLLSVGSLWEIAIKVSTGKLILEMPFEILVPQQLSLNRISLLDIAVGHVIQVSNLPYHHKDPFDRLLIAQAIVEQLPVVSADMAFDNYGVTRLW